MESLYGTTEVGLIFLLVLGTIAVLGFLFWQSFRFWFMPKYEPLVDPDYESEPEPEEDEDPFMGIEFEPVATEPPPQPAEPVKDEINEMADWLNKLANGNPQ